MSEDVQCAPTAEVIAAAKLAAARATGRLVVHVVSNRLAVLVAHAEMLQEMVDGDAAHHAERIQQAAWAVSDAIHAIDDIRVYREMLLGGEPMLDLIAPPNDEM